MIVMVGGTFDFLHIGHRSLLRCAFTLAGSGGHVLLGLSADEFAAGKIHPVKRYEQRRKELTEWISEMNFPATYEIEPIYDKFGSALSKNFDALVVSAETFPVGEEINQRRHSQGLAKVDLIQIENVLAEDGKLVSTTRVYAGEINPDGTRRWYLR